MRAGPLCLLLVAALASGCGPTSAPPQRAPDPRPVWPTPPARARIRYLRSLGRPADLGVGRTFWGKLARIIAGRTDEWLVRPTSVAARGGVLYVADPGAQALWMLDARHSRIRKIVKSGKDRFVSPVAVATRLDGRIFLSDSFLAKVFVFDRNLKPTAVITDPDFKRPSGLAVDPGSNRLYVADSGAHRVWIFGADGTRVGVIGRRGTGEGEFNFPTHVAVDGAGTIYVSDSLNFRVQMFERDGRFLDAFGRHGDSSGDFANPKGIAVDGEGNIYVVEPLFDAVQIFDRQGRFLLSFGERGRGPGEFWLPVGVSIDAADRLYVADSYNRRIQVFQYLAAGGDE